MFPVRYEPNSYINLLRNSVFEDLKLNYLRIYLRRAMGNVLEMPKIFQWRNLGSGCLCKSKTLSCPLSTTP
jgi:hypothetical protein